MEKQGTARKMYVFPENYEARDSGEVIRQLPATEGGVVQSAQQIRQGALPRAGGTKDHHELSTFRGEAHSVQLQKLMLPATVVLMFVFDWRMGAACLLAAVVSVGAMFSMMGGKNAKLMAEYQAAQDVMSKAGTEYVRGIPVVKVFQQTVYKKSRAHRNAQLGKSKQTCRKLCSFRMYPAP